MCCFRFKLWWMTEYGNLWKGYPFGNPIYAHRESKDDAAADLDNIQTIFTVLLPLLEGQFRAVLQGNDKNEIEIFIESGE